MVAPPAPSGRGPDPGTAARRSPAGTVTAALLLAALITAAPAAAQTPDSSLWVPNGPVRALLRDGNTLYVGGAFTELAMATGGGVPISPAHGFPAGPFPSVLGSVHAVVADGVGGWFIGGEFASVGGHERYNLAHVLADGSVAPWAPQANGAVRALALRGNRVYAGGDFRWVGMRWRDRLAAIDVTTGVATSWNPGADAAIHALILRGDTLYAGGAFTAFAGGPRNRLAAFETGTGALAPWDPGANGDVHALALAGDTLLAGGAFTVLGGSPRAYVGSLDAMSGSVTGWDPRANGSVFAIAAGPGTVYLGGAFSSVGWQTRRHLAAVDRASATLRSWDALADQRVSALALAGDTLYAGGSFLAIGGSRRRHLAALDATTGLALPWDPRPDAAVRALAAAGTVVYAGGSFLTFGGIERRHCAALDVVSGFPLPWNPAADGPVSALARAGGTVYVAGSFTVIGGAGRGGLAALEAQTGVATPWDPRPNGVVASLAAGGGIVYAGGEFSQIGGVGRNRIAALDAVSGIATGWSPGATGTVTDLLLDGSTLYVAGAFSYVGGALRGNLAALSVTSGLATPWDPGANGPVDALALEGGLLYAGGRFSSIGGASRARLAALDRETGLATPWNPGTSGAIGALAPGGGAVHVGGSFSEMNGAGRANLAALDAASGATTLWSADADGAVAALATAPGTLYAGGAFTTVSGRLQPNLAALGAAASAPSADPVFVGAVELSATTIAVGETLTVTATVRNDGAASDDGRIVFSFKDLVDPLDAGRVTGAAPGGAPGFRLVPRGDTLLTRDCRRIPADHLVAEYADAEWAGLGAETHTITLTVRPRTAGVFSIDVRTTMRAAGGSPCDFANALPPGGNTTITDQQGWTVRRFVVYVTGTPGQVDPVMSDVSLWQNTITLGQTFTLTTDARNAGAMSDDGRIVVSFPSLTDPLDAARVRLDNVVDDLPGYRAWTAGAPVPDTACATVAAPYLIVEYADSTWQPILHENNPLWLKVTPRETGPFHIDVRTTMRTAGGAACGYVNTLPPNGEAGFRDAQGWPVKRFTVNVLAPPPAADPEFNQPVWISADSIVIGQSITLTASVRNPGRASDDGRIVLAFPTLTDTLDAARVTGSAPNDLPGYRAYPVGSALLGRDCEPVTARYLVAEYVDDDWGWLGSETNNWTVTVTPREVGDFVVDVRATMRTAGGAPCDYVSDVPPNGAGGFIDPQGWPVRRFVIRVGPAPTTALPVFTEPVSVSATVLELGRPFTLTARVRNDGARSDDGRIVVSFTALTDPADTTRVTADPDAGDTAGFRTLAAGAFLAGADCAPVRAPHLVAEYADADWDWIGRETRVLALTVWPREAGTFSVDVRATMRTAGAGACDYVNARPPNGVDSGPDAFGWEVRRFTVTVVPVPPAPVFLAPVTVSPAVIELGQAVTLTAAVRNDGAPSDDGRVVFSFPGLTHPLDVARVAGGAGGGPTGFRTLPVGAPLLDADCRPMTAGYLVAEYTDPDWQGFAAETRRCTLTVRPRHAGTFVIEVRASLHATGPDPCAIASVTPPNGQGGTTDQQGWAVRRFTVTVTGPPTVARPEFVGPAVVSTDALPRGEALTITAVVRNAGAASDDGRIVIGFPGLSEPGDAQWVSAAAGSDAPGFRLLPAGSTLLGRDCRPLGAAYLVAEYADAAWDSIGDETDTLTLTVRPPREGLFAVEIRSTMRTAGAGACDYVNAAPANGQGGFTDQQGWEVRRFDVLVGSPSSMMWRPVDVAGAGPSPRSAQAAVYDPVRDELVLNGGTALTYAGDSWSLPLAGANWTSIQPGGPVPLVRIQHSMVFDPVTNHLIIFGGYYNVLLNDLWVLARAPVHWWFPIDVSGERPSPRMGHAALYDPVRDRMLVVGGFDGGMRSDVWEYSPTVNGTWRRLAPAGTPPPGRATHSAIYDPVRDRVIVFGGDGGPFLNDVWELTLGGGLAWNRLTPAGAPPSARREHTAIYHARQDEMVVFGGFDGTRRLNDVWTLPLSGAPVWERRFSSSPSPSGRAQHSAVYDPPRARMIVFGGQTASTAFSSEVWELTVDASTPVALSLAGVEVAPDGVTLTWFGEGAGTLRALVERRTAEEAWQPLGPPEVADADRLVCRDRQITPGARYGYRLRVWTAGGEELLEPIWLNVPARPELRLAGARPNPASGPLHVELTLPARGDGALELFDLRGRLVARHDLAALDAGPHRIAVADSRRLAAGIYLVRLTHRGHTRTAKACVVR